MFKLIVVIFISLSANAATVSETKVDKTIDKAEILENPTLKVESGSLKKFSFYSKYVYSGGDLVEPFSAEKPNIRDLENKPNLTSFAGAVGLKYRMTKFDNFSFQLGLHSTSPFHDSLDSDDATNQLIFDENKGKVGSDDPIISYFRTYYIGELQNISFVKYQYVTRDMYRDLGYKGIFSFSHAAAYRLNKAAYIAGSFTYENYAYDKSNMYYNGYKMSLRESQAEHKLRANLSAEMYFRRNLSFRLITDLFSRTQMRDTVASEEAKLQQTIAATYFFTRDISIAPNIKFIAEDIRADRTNIGLTLNLNL